MGVLKAIKSSETVNISVKIPADLQDQINQVREKSKALGFTVDIHEAAIKGIRRLITSADKELKELAAKQKPKAESAPEKTAEKTPPKPPARPSGKIPPRPAATA